MHAVVAHLELERDPVAVAAVLDPVCEQLADEDADGELRLGEVGQRVDVLDRPPRFDERRGVGGERKLERMRLKRVGHAYTTRLGGEGVRVTGGLAPVEELLARP